MIAQWREHLGTENVYTVQEIIGRAVNEANFHTALVNVAASKNGHLIDNRRLGWWLKRVQGRIWDGVALHKMGSKDGYPRWQLVPK